MQNFLSQTRRISEEINTLTEYKEKFIYISNTKSKSVLKESEERNLESQIKVLNNMFSQLSSKIKLELKKMSEENEKIQNEEKESNFLYETRNNHWQVLTKKLVQAINSYRESQVNYNNIEKDRLKSQYIIAKPTATEEELEELTSEKGQEHLKNAFSLGSSSAKQMYSRAKERSNNIQKLAESVEELCQMISDLDEMVKSSDVFIDRIGVSMSSTKHSVKKTNKDLESALRYQRSAMRIKRYIFAGIGVVVLIILIWLGIKFLGNQNSGNGGNNN
ncbi:syntaxin [Hamiltosporidium tvaerminnensis]|uniref:Syntaxin n=2 Tax=Hamiltosporidium TaxID=1176354 RepID=A0A4Q9L110_9MICR|nr:hypothetical protein LUQ84_000827 [Hamiltosporidium tvaerminnensis]TBU00665.1 syntaxin [Hamiltosporidium magnivora]TBU03327.1 syntaxin [Hamiltosporidium tvaerminnensis]TBU03515.1 syntaxin [Hamiltosporidium magnivora]TBU09558.1 syntaxin [Hamiltosporidium magnivora]